MIHDVSNACLGVLTGMVDIANRIELGQIRAGMVVSCETAREINEIVIEQMLENPSMEFFKRSLATLTGGSGAVAVVLTDGSFSAVRKAGGSWAGRTGLRRGFTGSAAGASRRPSRATRALSAVHLDRRGGRAHPWRRAGQSRPGATSRRRSAGTTAKSTR